MRDSTENDDLAEDYVLNNRVIEGSRAFMKDFKFCRTFCCSDFSECAMYKVKLRSEGSTSITPVSVCITGTMTVISK